MEEKKNKNWLFIVVLALLVLETSYLVYDKYINKEESNSDKIQTNENKKENNTPKENEPTQEVVNNFKQAGVSNLSNKLSKLDFTTKKIATAGVDDEIPFSISIVSDKEIKITHNYAGLSYSLYIENAISVGAGLNVEGSGEAVFYVLTADGSVYNIVDDIGKVKSNNAYTGTLKNIGIKNATQIAVSDSFSLNDDAVTTLPNVYIKTSDSKIYTSEKLLDNESIVQVIEK